MASSEHPAVTSLPAPTAEALTPEGRWPHMLELRTELTALVADLEPATIPAGPDAREAAQRLLGDGWRRVMVGVYASLGREEVMLGWYPTDRVPAVVDRVLAYLPGAREREPEHAEDSMRITWGSRTPGWSPTAVWVVRGVTTTWREPGDLWDAARCAEHCGISTDTWRSYVTRRNAGAPIAYGETVLPGQTRRTLVWDRQQVIDWHAGRPGKGGRPIGSTTRGRDR